MKQICLAITAIALAVSAAVWLAGCAQQQNLWNTICADQAAHVQNAPLAFVNSAQAALLLHDLCGTVAPSPTPTPVATPTPAPTHA